MKPADRMMVTIRYANHRGEVADRRIAPVRVWFGSTKYHPKPQWLLRAFCMARADYRDFALADIREWLPPK